LKTLQITKKLPTIKTPGQTLIALKLKAEKKLGINGDNEVEKDQKDQKKRVL